METIYLGRKHWSNASAFLTYNPTSKEICVYGKFSDGYKSFPGPEVVVCTAPEVLVDELNKFETGRTPSPRLAQFIKKAWEIAKAKDSWFNY